MKIDKSGGYGVYPCIKCGQKKMPRFKNNPCGKCKKEMKSGQLDR